MCSLMPYKTIAFSIKKVNNIFPVVNNNTPEAGGERCRWYIIIHVFLLSSDCRWKLVLTRPERRRWWSQYWRPWQSSRRTLAPRRPLQLWSEFWQVLSDCSNCCWENSSLWCLKLLTFQIMSHTQLKHICLISSFVAASLTSLTLA